MSNNGLPSDPEKVWAVKDNPIPRCPRWWGCPWGLLVTICSKSQILKICQLWKMMMAFNRITMWVMKPQELDYTNL